MQEKDLDWKMPGERLVTIGIRKDLTDKIKYTFPKPHDYKPVLRDVLFDCRIARTSLMGRKRGEFSNWFLRAGAGET